MSADSAFPVPTGHWITLQDGLLMRQEQHLSRNESLIRCLCVKSQRLSRILEVQLNMTFFSPLYMVQKKDALIACLRREVQFLWIQCTASAHVSGYGFRSLNRMHVKMGKGKQFLEKGYFWGRLKQLFQGCGVKALNNFEWILSRCKILERNI